MNLNYYVNYVPYVDYCTLGIIFIFYVILGSSYYSKNVKNHIFKVALFILLIGTITDVYYMKAMQYLGAEYKYLIYSLRDLSDISLLLAVHIFNYYINTMFDINKKFRKTYNIIGNIGLVFFSIWMITTPFTHLGFYIEDSGLVHGNFMIDPFTIGYIYFCTILVYQLLRFKKAVLTKAYYAIMTSCAFSLLVMLDQALTSSSTFVTFTYAFPMIIMFILFHSNSYNLEMGYLDSNSFDDYLVELYKTKKDFHMISLCFEPSENIDSVMLQMRVLLLHFYEKYFAKAYVFRLNERRLILVYKKNKTRTFKNFEKEFYDLYNKYKLEYKLIYLKSNPKLEINKNYTNYVKFLEKKVELNSFYISTEEDLESFFKQLEIINVLKDIDSKRNLDDERVVAFAQPIYDNKKNGFMTAESLMRLNVQDKLLTPNFFIEVAEENHYIYTLTMIMLNKVCKNIKYFIDKGYVFDRVTLNITTEDLMTETFTEDFINIVKTNYIPFDKIGVEITESKAMDYSEIHIDKLNTLKEYGIKIYLDDFGTGYSNFERIMRVPIDVIKFDKSLLDSSMADKKYQIIVKNLTKTYYSLGYEILFEGIENDESKDLCTDNFYTRYLQGYLYSKPIEMIKLVDFFKKTH